MASTTAKKRSGGPQKGKPILVRRVGEQTWERYETNQAAIDDNEEMKCKSNPLQSINHVLNPDRANKTFAGFEIKYVEGADATAPHPGMRDPRRAYGGDDESASASSGNGSTTVGSSDSGNDDLSSSEVSNG